MNNLLQQEVARIGAPLLAEVLIEMRDNQRILIKKVTSLEEANARLMSGFPAEDVEGHRRYHESVIEWRELRNKMVREALTKMAGAGALATIGWLAVAIWKSFKISVFQ